MSDSLQSYGLQLTKLTCPLPFPGVCSNSSPLSQSCHPTSPSLVSPSLLALSLSQHQGLFQWVDSSHQATKVLELHFQHQSFQWIIRVGFPLGLTGLISCIPNDSTESSPTPQFKSINSLVLSFLYSPTFPSIHDYWKSHRFDKVELCWHSNISAF